MSSMVNPNRRSRVPRSLAETAWFEIREQILTGTLSPGSPIRVKEQAELLGMSMMPVREAVRQLRQEGLVAQETHKESIVAPLSIGDMEDIYTVRISLESLALERACDYITEARYKELSGILDKFEQAYQANNIAEGREWHREFHIQLCAVAQSPTLDRLIPTLIDSSERYRVLSVNFRGPVEERRKEHQQILDACYRRDREAARQEIISHLERTVDIVRKALIDLETDAQESS